LGVGEKENQEMEQEEEVDRASVMALGALRETTFCAEREGDPPANSAGGDWKIIVNNRLKRHSRIVWDPGRTRGFAVLLPTQHKKKLTSQSSQSIARKGFRW